MSGCVLICVYLLIIKRKVRCCLLRKQEYNLWMICFGNCRIKLLISYYIYLLKRNKQEGGFNN